MGNTAVYDADLQGYFDSIPHDKQMKGLETRISDGSMLRLIRLFLRAPIQDGKKPPTRPGGGTPQGGVISPQPTWAKARLVRHADDFVVMARYIDHRIIGFIEEKIEGRLGLVINREKTRVVQVKSEDATLDFLGDTFAATNVAAAPGTGEPRHRRRRKSGRVTSCAT